MINLSTVTLLFLFVGGGLGQLYSASTDGTTIGAVYTMSNSETTNQIVVNRLNSNGKLSYVRTLSTNGMGENRTLFSTSQLGQRVIQVYSNYLFAVNPGSNSLSMFTINPSDATSVILNTTATVFGQYPVSVTVSPTYACVLTRFYTAEISCFPYNSSGFLLSRITYNITSYLVTTYPNGYLSLMPSQLLFSADNSVLIVSVSGSSFSVPNRILFFQLTSGMLVLLSDQLLNNSASISTMTLVGTNSLLIVSYSFSSGSFFTQFINYLSTNTSVTFTSISPSTQTLGSALFGTLYSSNTNNYYSIINSGIAEMKVNLSSAQVDPFFIASYYPSLCISNDPSDTTIVTSGDTDYMFVMNSAVQLITSYQLQSGNDPTANCYIAPQQTTTNLNRVAGIAAYIQTSSSSSSIRTMFPGLVFALISLIHLL